MHNQVKPSEEAERLEAQRKRAQRFLEDFQLLLEREKSLPVSTAKAILQVIETLLEDES